MVTTEVWWQREQSTGAAMRKLASKGKSFLVKQRKKSWEKERSVRSGTKWQKISGITNLSAFSNFCCKSYQTNNLKNEEKIMFGEVAYALSRPEDDLTRGPS